VVKKSLGKSKDHSIDKMGVNDIAVCWRCRGRWCRSSV